MFKPLFETKQSKMSLRINTSNENKVYLIFYQKL